MAGTERWRACDSIKDCPSPTTLPSNLPSLPPLPTLPTTLHLQTISYCHSLSVVAELPTSGTHPTGLRSALADRSAKQTRILSRTSNNRDKHYLNPTIRYPRQELSTPGALINLAPKRLFKRSNKFLHPATAQTYEHLIRESQQKPNTTSTRQLLKQSLLEDLYEMQQSAPSSVTSGRSAPSPVAFGRPVPSSVPFGRPSADCGRKRRNDMLFVGASESDGEPPSKRVRSAQDDEAIKIEGGFAGRQPAEPPIINASPADGVIDLTQDSEEYWLEEFQQSVPKQEVEGRLRNKYAKIFEGQVGKALPGSGLKQSLDEIASCIRDESKTVSYILAKDKEHWCKKLKAARGALKSENDEVADFCDTLKRAEYTAVLKRASWLLPKQG
ncbi:hypothetical protein BST61_g6680 [Cercospora zeina]